MTFICLIRGLWLLTVLYIFECSKVIDEHDQRENYVKEYCKEIGICIAGSHVMCTHYDPRKKMRPACIGTKDVSMTQEYADFILNSFNGVRSRVARGINLGPQRVPRGYGILRLQWDPELATFAQVWANQCVLTGDDCRATKRFPDPGQIRGVTRFYFKTWTPLTWKDRFNYTGFSSEKVQYGIESTLASWYKTKSAINDIESVIKGHIWDSTISTSPFLQIVQASASHVGCGLSVYTAMMNSETGLGFEHLVRVVCNFSTRIHEGDLIYNLEPPNKVGYTRKCGCPLGYDEDSGCLCYESGRQLPYSCNYGRCKPKIVVLPIFTFENVPLPKRSAANALSVQGNTSDMRENLRRSQKIRRYTDNKSITQYRQNRGNSSIFTRAPIFVLPTRKIRHNNDSLSIRRRDVSPRRESSHVHHTMTAYSRNRNPHPRNTKYNWSPNILAVNYQNHRNYMYRLNNGRNISETANDDKFLSLKDTNDKQFHGDTRSIKTSRTPSIENSDAKLMKLLNELEEEAKFLRLEDSEKDLLDRKIKKIYGHFINKSYNDDIKLLKQYHNSRREEHFLSDAMRNRQDGLGFPDNLSTRKMLYLHKKLEPTDFAPYFRNKDYHEKQYVDDNADSNKRPIPSTYKEYKWIYSRPRVLQFYQ